jgi:hydroxymethylbilane synthase
VIEHERLGAIEYFYGQLDDGRTEHSLLAEREMHRGGATFWPQKQLSLFRRIPLHGVNNPGSDLFVARADALPEQWAIMPSQLLWTAGLETWKKLAARGVWVHGSSEGLGERFPPLAALAGRAPGWVKLSHASSENDSVFPVHPTYRLEADQDFDVPLVDEYFWTSATAFRMALAQRPEIRERSHVSGPGYTATAIEKELGRPAKICLSLARWLGEA